MIEDLKAKNAAFAALSDRDKRLAVIEDIIQQVEAGLYNLQGGVYFFQKDDAHRFATGQDLQAILHDPSYEPCQVCARGAFFASMVRLSDGVQLPDRGISHEGKYNELGHGLVVFNDKEKELFDNDQTALIECAYMVNNGFKRHLTYEQAQQAVDFIQQAVPASDDRPLVCTRKKERLMAILNNMKANDGLFCP